MKLSTRVKLIFKNKEGEPLELITSFSEILSRHIDDFLEDLEPECTSSSCNNESQNFCDCGSVYEDYEISEFELL